ncbi:MAG: AMP-binding protein [Nocardioidaceae bacterium]
MSSPAAASLRPVSGSPAAVEARLRRWIAAPAGPLDVEPLTIRTSGSTGEPKDVVLSTTALRASATATLARLGGPGQWVLALPVPYVAGLQVVVRSILAGTSPVTLADHPDLATACAALTGERRYLAAVPTQLHRWLADDTQAAALTELDAVLIGGSGVSTALLDTARARGVTVVTTYGMSETCGGCVYDGVPLDGVGVALGPQGEIRLSGPMLFAGYDGQPGLTAQVVHDGWLHTPDLGRLDADGRLEVLGRADDVVVSGGENIPLPTVERRLAQMPPVAHCALVGLPDPEWGTRVVAVVVPAAGCACPDLDSVRGFVAEELPRHWAPRAVVTSEQLPMLTSGKVDRQTLVRELSDAPR